MPTLSTQVPGTMPKAALCLPSPAGLPRLMSCSSSGMEGALEDSQGAQDGSYSPQEALELALRDWVAEINQQALEPGKMDLHEEHPSIPGVGGEELHPAHLEGLGLVWHQGHACHGGHT